MFKKRLKKKIIIFHEKRKIVYKKEIELKQKVKIERRFKRFKIKKKKITNFLKVAKNYQNSKIRL